MKILLADQLMTDVVRTAYVVGRLCMTAGDRQYSFSLLIEQANADKLFLRNNNIVHQ
ncbi:hypothetical protein [Chitinophaga pinensis]|uniref:hypothetical protein n=1 Tax=Chitinophaga pinensis TaxID=79329 RepID=UPI00164972A8|nr:hypothetical protein [Chitinophaga pinensis]